MHNLNVPGVRDSAPFGVRNSSDIRGGIFDKDPERVPFPLGSQFSRPAKYHTKGQKFQVGDTVWYELKGSFQNSRDFIQWGEATVKCIVDAEKDLYHLAGKTWAYDHYTHPLIGTPGGPSQYMNMSPTNEQSKLIYRNWAQVNHPNSHVRRNALLGVDEVMHPGLMSVPGEAMFKVWDRETLPESPIEKFPSIFKETNYNDSLNTNKGGDHGVGDDEGDESGPGPDLQFQGAKQNGYGPEMWGITVEQLKAVKELEGYNDSMSMYDVVEDLIKPQTRGKGVGYALLVNKDKPLRAKYMVSHAWGEKYDHFIRAIEHCGCDGLWVCAMAIYQNEDIPAITISKQLGPSVQFGPFATVLKQASQMIAVFTPAADIYTRMWCVFEIFMAVKNGVPVQFAALSYQFLSGMENFYDAIFEHGKKVSPSVNARCGDPSKPMNDDEKKIRKLIEAFPGKFQTIDAVIEWCKATYHIKEAHHPGTGFRSDPEHYLFLGGPGRFDFLAKNLSAVALAIDRLEEASEGITSVEEENLCNSCCII